MISLPNPLRWRPALRHLMYAAALLPVFALVHFVGYWLRFDGDIDQRVWDGFCSTVVRAVAVKLVLFGWFRIYPGWGRYVTFHDLVALVKAVTAGSLLLLVFDSLVRPPMMLPRSILLMDWGLAIVVVGGIRASSRFLRESARPALLTWGETPVFIAGANDSGEALLRSIRQNPRLPYRVVGFLAEDPGALNSRIGGVPVIGLLEQACQLAEQHGVSQVLLTAGDLPGQKVRALVEQANQTEMSVTVLPSYEQLIRGTVDLRPRQVSIEDLLRREPVQLNLNELQQWLEGRVLMVTGSAGSIGSEICRQLLPFAPKQLVAVDRSETGQFFLDRELRQLSPASNVEICLADINDPTRMENLFRQYRPDIVFHAAAYKHVPLMEQHPGEAVKNITLATCHLADLAEAWGVSSFVMISTDKAVNPTSVMGTCKRIGELYVQAKAENSTCQFVTVRFGNVLDSAGSVIPVFREQIARGGPVTITHPEMVRYFMTIPEASQLVLQAGAMGRGGEIFVLDMGDPVRIEDLARDLIRLSGLKVEEDIELAYTGIRPGEKLYEELHCDGERHLPTAHPKIQVAESAPAELAVLQGAIEHLRQIADEPAGPILAVLRNIVPQGAAVRAMARPRGSNGRATPHAGPLPLSPVPVSRDIIPLKEPVSWPPAGRRKSA